MREDEGRTVLGSLASGVLGIGMGLAILGIGFVVSRVALPDNVVVASVGTPAPTATAAATSRATAATAPTATPTTAAASATPSPTPAPTRVAAAQGQGLRLAAITVPAGYVFMSPIAGRVSISLYQYVNGEVRTGVADQPSYPYIFVRAADREVKIRPGLVDTDIRLLVKDGDTITAGTPLFRTLTTGASSWATFYDASVTAQVVVSATALPSGVEIDPVAVFSRP